MDFKGHYTMEIHHITLTPDEYLDWINTLSSEKKKHVLLCFDDATKYGGGKFFAEIEMIENQFCFTVLIYQASKPHAIEALSFQAPATPEGRAELKTIRSAIGGEEIR